MTSNEEWLETLKSGDKVYYTSDNITEEQNTTEPITFKYLRCGKRFTSYGRKAELLNQITSLLFEYGEVVGKTSKRKTTPTILNIVEYHAKCCDRPLILNTYPELGEY